MSTAQVADATDLMLMTKPPLLAWTNQATIGRKFLRMPYKALKPQKHWSGGTVVAIESRRR
jgi:hypothetical protein